MIIKKILIFVGNIYFVVPKPKTLLENVCMLFFAYICIKLKSWFTGQD